MINIIEVVWKWYLLFKYIGLVVIINILFFYDVGNLSFMDKFVLYCRLYV